MKKIMIWDVAIRVFHWSFALSCVGSLAIGLFADDDSAIFPMHMLLGISAAFLLVVRLALAILGCRHNRLGAMLFSPAETLRYIGGIIIGTPARYIVHNPGTSAVAMGMFLLVPFLFWTGLDGENEDIHEVLAYVLLALIAAHIAGLVIYTLRHRENISLSMITGFKQGPPENNLQSSYPIVGTFVLLFTLVWIGSLFANYNAANMTVRIPLLKSTIQLGEKDDHHQHHETESDERVDDESEDDD